MDEILLLNIDVSFAATSFALADLAQYKDTQEKVQQEIDEVLRGGDPSSFPDLDKKLPYMEMVLKESARMHPALALSLPERTVKQVTDLGGFQIPKGVRVWLCHVFCCCCVKQLHTRYHPGVDQYYQTLSFEGTHCKKAQFWFSRCSVTTGLLFLYCDSSRKGILGTRGFNSRYGAMLVCASILFEGRGWHCTKQATETGTRA